MVKFRTFFFFFKIVRDLIGTFFFFDIGVHLKFLNMETIRLNLT